MDAECKPKTTDMIDSIVSAEIPDQDTNPKLYEIITSQNIHGPCGNVNPKSPCIDGNKTMYQKLPQILSTVYTSHKKFLPVQILEGKLMSRKSMAMTLLWIIRLLFLTTRPCLCGFKLISMWKSLFVQALKYIYKYIQKAKIEYCWGLEKTLRMMKVTDTSMQDTFLQVSEAFWRLYGFEFHQ